MSARNRPDVKQHLKEFDEAIEAEAKAKSVEGSSEIAASPSALGVVGGWVLIIRDLQGNELWRGPHDGGPWAPGLHAVVKGSIRRIISTIKTETEETVIVAEAPNTEVTQMHSEDGAANPPSA